MWWWRLISGLRPLGWLGVLVAALGTQMVDVAARRGDWELTGLGVVLLLAGAIIVLRNRRRAAD